MKLPYSVSLKQENCRRLWCKLIDTTWKISKVMITYFTYIHFVLHISNGPTTSLFLLCVAYKPLLIKQNGASDLETL